MENWHHILHQYTLQSLASPFDILNLVQIVTFGFVTSWHCVGMCCPLLFTISASNHRFGFLRYQIGRWLSYCAIGATLSFTLQGANHIHDSLSSWLAMFLGVAIISAGMLRIFSLRLPNFFAKFLAPVSHLPTRLLRRIGHKNQTLFLGLSTGMLPCMTLSPAYLAAASSNSQLLAMITMSGFFLGTLPSFVLAKSIPHLSSKFINISESRVLVGIFWILTGVLTIARVWHNAH